MKIIMFIASLLCIPFLYLLAIIPTAFIAALCDLNENWLIWVVTGFMYIIALEVLMSAADSYKRNNESA